MKIKSVFIVEPINGVWITEQLMRDIAARLSLEGVSVRIGKAGDYSDEDVVFHSRYLYATPIAKATINSVFVTHIDDYLKEFELKNEFRIFDSFVCLSQQDAAFLQGLGCNKVKLLGNNLPHRDGFLLPQKLAMFSARYADGRKNEDWLLEYFAKSPPYARRSVVLCLIGYDWELYCQQLADIGMSYELYRYDRSLPGEYDIQQRILSGMDYLLYPGFDGGAMCVYDGIMAGTKLIIADNSYHRGLGCDVRLFKNKKEFFSCLDEVIDSRRQRENIWEERSIAKYVNNLMHHWEYLVAKQRSSIGHGQIESNCVVSSNDNDLSEVDLLRSHYKNISIRRLGSSIYRMIRKLLSK